MCDGGSGVLECWWEYGCGVGVKSQLTLEALFSPCTAAVDLQWAVRPHVPSRPEEEEGGEGGERDDGEEGESGPGDAHCCGKSNGK